MTDGATAGECPSDPEVDDTWVDEDGELHTWNGKGWVPFMEIPAGGLGTELPTVFRNTEE